VLGYIPHAKTKFLKKKQMEVESQLLKFNIFYISPVNNHKKFIARKSQRSSCCKSFRVGGNSLLTQGDLKANPLPQSPLH
jgi:hypothetical protein